LLGLAVGLNLQVIGVAGASDGFHAVSKPTRAGFVALFKGSEVTVIVIHLS
jgi:hypothetical protein